LETGTKEVAERRVDSGADEPPTIIEVEVKCVQFKGKQGRR
jgi:hypothetical protein